MSEFLKNLPDSLRLIKERFYNWDGLLISTGIVSYVNYLFWTAASDLLKSILDSAYKENSLAIFISANVGSYVLIILIVLAAWIYKRRIRRFQLGAAGILFSSTNPPELQSQVNELQARVTDEVKRRDLLNFIQVKSLPPNIIIKDVQTASITVTKARAVLLIWGPFESSDMQGQRVTGFPRVNFTCALPSAVSKEFHEQIATSLIGRKWNFEQNNEFVDKTILAENIAEVALNIVGMALMVKGYFDQAEAIFAALDVAIEKYRQNQASPPALLAFCANVRKNRVRSMALVVQREYRRLFMTQGVFHSAPGELNRWKVKNDGAIALDKQDSELYVMNGILNFLMGNMQESWNAIRKAKKRAPTADPSPDFCAAFLHFFNGQFRKGLSSYNIAFAKKGSYNYELIVNLVEFIRQTLERHPEKFQLHYALGILNEQRLDSSQALDAYRLFAEKARNDPYYSSFIQEAEKKIAKLSQVVSVRAPA